MNKYEQGSPLYPTQYCRFIVVNAGMMQLDDIIFINMQTNPFFHEDALFRVKGEASKDSWILELIEADYIMNAPFVLPKDFSLPTIYRKADSADSVRKYAVGQIDCVRNILASLDGFDILEDLNASEIKVGDVIPVEHAFSMNYFRQVVNVNPLNSGRGVYVVKGVYDGKIVAHFTDEFGMGNGLHSLPFGFITRYDVWRNPKHKQ